jgi:hypothetical protein
LALDLLEISGCLVTIDAMHRPTEIAQTVVDANADYVLAVKTNQPTLASWALTCLASCPIIAAFRPRRLGNLCCGSGHTLVEAAAELTHSRHAAQMGRVVILR